MNYNKKNPHLNDHKSHKKKPSSRYAMNRLRRLLAERTWGSLVHLVSRIFNVMLCYGL